MIAIRRVVVRVLWACSHGRLGLRLAECAFGFRGRDQPRLNSIRAYRWPRMVRRRLEIRGSDSNPRPSAAS